MELEPRPLPTFLEQPQYLQEIFFFGGLAHAKSYHHYRNDERHVLDNCVFVIHRLIADFVLKIVLVLAEKCVQTNFLEFFAVVVNEVAVEVEVFLDLVEVGEMRQRN